MTGFVPAEWRLPIYALSCIALALIVAAGLGRINEARHLAGIDADRTESIAVVLGFEPERFHIEAFQEVGRYQGWNNGRAIIMAIDPVELRKLARNYWVSEILPLEEAQ